MAAARRARELGLALVLVGNKSNEARKLINKGADVNYVDRWMHERVEKSTTPLIQAAACGHANVVSVLIEKVADVNKPNPRNRGTALHMAAEHGQKDAAIALLDHGAKIDAQDKDGYTPVLMAAQEGHLPLVDLLFVRGADIHLSNFQGTTPLTMAAQQGHLDVVKFLVEKGAVVDQPTSKGCKALLMASRHGHLEIVDFLFSAEATNLIDSSEMSPLYAASEGGHLNVVKLLVKKGVNIHQASDQGVTPLQTAALYGHQEVVDYLMMKGAQFDACGTIAKACKCCGAAGVSLMKCEGCRIVFYCSPECQKKDWKEGGEKSHKVQCKRLVEMRVRYVEKAKKEIEKKKAVFGIQSRANGGEAGPSSAMS